MLAVVAGTERLRLNPSSVVPFFFLFLVLSGVFIILLEGEA
jgi:hypothetical protein